MGTTLDGIDLVNPDNYVERVPFEWFDELRRERPVSWHDEPGGNKGFWAVTRYDDLTAIHMDWQTYSSETGAVALEELDDEQLRGPQDDARDGPPAPHRAPQDLLEEVLGARASAVYEDFIRDVARSVLDQALPKGEFDFVSRDQPRAADPVPLLDLHRSAGGRAGADPLGRQDDREPGPRALATRCPTRSTPRRTGCCRSAPPPRYEVWAYADRQKELRQAEPTDDVISALTVAQDEGALNEHDFHNYFSLLMIAGNETTRHTITSRDARADGESRAAAAAAGRSVADLERHRGDPAVGDAGAALPPDGDARRRAPRAADQGRATRSSRGTSARTATRRSSPTPTGST